MDTGYPTDPYTLTGQETSVTKHELLCLCGLISWIRIISPDLSTEKLIIINRIRGKNNNKQLFGYEEQWNSRVVSHMKGNLHIDNFKDFAIILTWSSTK